MGAKIPQRLRAARLVGRHALAHVLLGLHLEVEAHLGVELAVARASPSAATNDAAA